MGYNAFGKPLNEAGRQLSEALKRSRAAAARQRQGGFVPPVPATSQWACPACGYPNLGRSLLCGQCEEPKPQEVA